MCLTIILFIISGRNSMSWKRKWSASWQLLKVKVKVWTLAIAPALTWVRLVTSSALQFRKWQLIDMSQWCRRALCGHPSPALTDNLTYTMQLADTPSPQSATLGFHPVAVATTYFPSLWGYEAELAWAHSRLAACSRLLAVDPVWVEPATSRLRVRYATTTPLHC